MDWTRIMNDDEFKKQLGQRIKACRKQRRLTQKELATCAGISVGQLNKYESGFNCPTPKTLVELANQLHTSLDALMTGHESENNSLANTRLIDRLKELEQINPTDQDAIITVIDALIIKHRTMGVLSPVDRQLNQSA